jgi:hypothetical protein
VGPAARSGSAGRQAPNCAPVSELRLDNGFGVVVRLCARQAKAAGRPFVEQLIAPRRNPEADISLVFESLLERFPAIAEDRRGCIRHSL